MSDHIEMSNAKFCALLPVQCDLARPFYLFLHCTKMKMLVSFLIFLPKRSPNPRKTFKSALLSITGFLTNLPILLLLLLLFRQRPFHTMQSRGRRGSPQTTKRYRSPQGEPANACMHSQIAVRVGFLREAGQSQRKFHVKVKA